METSEAPNVPERDDWIWGRFRTVTLYHATSALVRVSRLSLSFELQDPGG